MFARALLLGLLLVPLGRAPVYASGDEFFRLQVAPLLERHCVSCHQGDKPKGGLSFVSGKQALAGGDSGAILTPGKPDESLIVELISGDKPAMPKGARPLSADQIAIFRRWISEGAAWPSALTLRDKKLAGADEDWWSLRPLARPAVPDIVSDWIRTPIDAFILAKLKSLSLPPSSEATRRTLIRRVTYDLTGLPPTPREAADFLADGSADAYEKLIDRLLDSPRYGERWGRHWLDIVHFGESHGYDKDKPRPNAWPYRDYVIAAFNDDVPYRRFIEEQLAGDILFPDDPRGIVATGFIAAGPWDFVGHAELREGTLDKKITRSNDRDDMVATVMSTFVSLTVHCARCHNHKFDPISQEDYYRLQAVFAGIDRADRNYDSDPAVHRLRRELTLARAPLTARKKILDEIFKAVTSPEIREIDQRLADINRELAAIKSLAAGPASPTNGYHSTIEAKADVTKWVEVDLGRPYSVQQIVLIPARPTDFPDTPGFGFPPRFKVEVRGEGESSGPRIVLDSTATKSAGPGVKPVVLDLNDAQVRYIRVTATRLWPRTNDFIFALAELQAISAGKNVALSAKVTALDSIEAGRWGTKNLVDNFSSRALLGDTKSAPAELARREQLETEAARLADRRRAAVDAMIDEKTHAEVKSIELKIGGIDHHLAVLPAPLTVYGAASDFSPIGSFAPARTPRPVYLLHRGSDKTPGPEMTPGALECIAGLTADFRSEATDNDSAGNEGARRAALARWITDPRNPLTRRSIVNRVWQYHFGRGLVDTPNDFGHMGSRPTHPELLDWLAVELAEPTGLSSSDGTNDAAELTDRTSAAGNAPPSLNPGAGAPWSLKRLHRLILTSAVYRQLSDHRPAQAAIDSTNQYLWRQNRQRLEAEAIRDAALAVSGNLDPRMGGPSDRQFRFKDDHSPIYDYERFDVGAPEANRRSVYRFIVRSVPDPFMECLDAADPSLLTPKRNTTLTALQALSLLNHPFMVRQAEQFALRLQSISGNPARQIEAAYQLALGRDPHPAEVETLVEYARRHGLANVCRTIFNSNEFLFID